MRRSPWIACALALAAPVAAQAELYRWVDDRGVVNYSNIRPEGVRKVTQVEEDSRVSTVPGPSPEQLAWQRQLELEQRLARLERELAEQRAREAMLAAQAYPAYPPFYGGYTGYAGFGYAVYPGWVPAHRHRFAARAAFPPRAHAVVRHAPARGMRR